MQIQLNTGKGVEHTATLERWLDGELRQQLARFADHVARVEVHLSDENAAHAGKIDIRCTMEARTVRSGSVAVNEDSDNTDQAIRGALEKLKRTIASRIGRETDHRDRSSIRTAADPGGSNELDDADGGSGGAAGSDGGDGGD